MYFDEDDLASLQQAGQLQAVVLHEMGHVLGFGTHWDALGLLAEPALQGGLDPHFTGAQAIAAFDLAGGTGYAAGAKVPVEDQYGPGTADGHWRESVFLTELMTGLLDYGVTPLSAVTLASFADLGYAVDTTGNDALGKFPTHNDSILLLSELGFKTPSLNPAADPEGRNPTSERRICANIAEVVSFCEGWQNQRDRAQSR